MKANRKFVEEKEAVSAVIGVILMVAITVAIAATVYVYVSGMLGSGPETNATLSMVQSGSYVSITGITNGPVVNGTDVQAVFVNQTTGISTEAVLNAGNGNAANVDGGDTITTPAEILLESAGTKYTVQVNYGGDTIGTCVFTVP
jgi:flagellin-like protein